MTQDMRQKYIKRLMRAAQIRGYVTSAMILAMCADVAMMMGMTTRDDITPNYWALGGGMIGLFALCLMAEVNEKSRDRIKNVLEELKKRDGMAR